MVHGTVPFCCATERSGPCRRAAAHGPGLRTRRTTKKCSHQEPRRNFLFGLFIVSFSHFSLLDNQSDHVTRIGLKKNNLFLRDNDRNDAVQFENMFSPLATEQLSCDRFCVQAPFATSFWTVPAGWASCSTAPFDASIDTPSSNFIALMSGHTRLDVASPWKLVKGIRFTDARPDVMVDGCQTRGAHSEISSLAPAANALFTTASPPTSASGP